MNTTASDALFPADSSERAASRRLPWLDRLTLAAIVASVVAVTIPHLRSMAIRSNERDARLVLSWLGEEVSRLSRSEIPPDLPSFLAGLPQATRRVPDARILDAGLVAHHGYYLRLTLSPTAEPELCAWPCQVDRTGGAAYVWKPGGLYVSANLAPGWSGLERPPPRGVVPEAGNGWASLGSEHAALRAGH